MTRIGKRTYPGGIVAELYETADGSLVLIEHHPGVRIEPIHLRESEYHTALAAFGF